MSKHKDHDMSVSSVTTSYLLANLHCPSCVASIQDAVESLEPRPESVSPSIVTSWVTVRHSPDLALRVIQGALEDAGFEVVAVSPAAGDARPTPGIRDTTPAARRRQLDQEDDRRRRHIARCEVCRATAGEADEKAIPATGSSPGTTTRMDDIKTPEPIEPLVAISSGSDSDLWQATVAIGGMTCAACANSVTEELEKQDWVRKVVISLIGNSGTVQLVGRENVSKLVDSIEDIGFEATIDSVVPLEVEHKRPQQDRWKAVLAIGGMTCASCANTIKDELNKEPWVESIVVNLVENSATISFDGAEHRADILERIEDLGYDATVDRVEPLWDQVVTQRQVSIRVDGMFCSHCPERVMETLKESSVEIETALSINQPIMTIRYAPAAPLFTIRTILTKIADSDSAFEVSIYKPPTIEERSRAIRDQERRRLQYRILLTIVAAIPTFIIGVVFMSLVSDGNGSKHYLMQPLVGGVSRTQWAMFITATPVYFLAADIFHRRAIKELIVLWRPGSRTPILRRFYRFGSMNTLMSLGTTIAYVSSVIELIVYSANGRTADNSAFYFDSVVFLTLFLLLGRWIEAYSKTKTGDAVSMLMQLRPTKALLVDHGASSLVDVDMLDVGDIVRVSHGDSPPCDGVIVDGTTKFDESSLTGESRLVAKATGDEVYSGTINKIGPISIRITGSAGNSMLDQIVTAVREGQTKRAPIERLADRLTAVFVPVITLIAITTWVIWLSLGLSGSLPQDYLDISSGGWTVWSLEFAIAVFVVACPCGLALAAPTALYVGGDLATRYGFLVKGGGEAFEKASHLDCVVFDKTGTLTMGGEPIVIHQQAMAGGDDVLGYVKAVEERSSHPVARAIVSFCHGQSSMEGELKEVEERPGRGLVAAFSQLQLMIGNEALMAEHGVELDLATSNTLKDWKANGESVALVAVKRGTDVTINWRLAVIFGISDPIRPEAPSVIAALQKRGTEVWMLSGDHPLTAHAIGQQVGIPSSNIIAGVLPSEKSAKIQYLQRTLRARNRRGEELVDQRATVAMVGDGINDAPALSAADVGIAIGSGSDIAISSAEFVLVTSNLRALLTLLDLSRVVFWRIKCNFGWALLYNCIALPVAAGVLYPIVSNGNHVRLDPVWASLAMALSSISVVSSSLALKLKIRWIGFRPGNYENE